MCFTSAWSTLFFLAITIAATIAASVPVGAENWTRFRGSNGQGVSSETNLPVEWSATENVVWKTSIPGNGWSSPIVYDDHVFLTTATDEGKSCHVICVNRASNGNIVWVKRLSGTYSASPVLADGRIYILSEQGVTLVLRPGPTYNEIGRNMLDEECMASMAVSQGHFYIRTAGRLYCIGVSDKTPICGDRM